VDSNDSGIVLIIAAATTTANITTITPIIFCISSFINLNYTHNYLTTFLEELESP